MDKAMGSQPRGCGFETNCGTNSFLLFFVLILLLKIHNTTSDTYPKAFDSKSEDREEITDTSAPALEMVEEQGTYTPGSRKSTRKNFEKPASSFSDFYM